MFPEDLPPYPSIALGTAEMSVAELAGSFSSYANRGKAGEALLSHPNRR